MTTMTTVTMMTTTSTHDNNGYDDRDDGCDDYDTRVPYNDHDNGDGQSMIILCSESCRITSQLYLGLCHSHNSSTNPNLNPVVVHVDLVQDMCP